jgi:hypothetical protein
MEAKKQPKEADKQPGTDRHILEKHIMKLSKKDKQNLTRLSRAIESQQEGRKLFDLLELRDKELAK